MELLLGVRSNELEYEYGKSVITSGPGSENNVKRGFVCFFCKETSFTPSVAYLKMTRLDDRGYLFVHSKGLVEI